MGKEEIITLYTFKDIVEATMALQKLKEAGIDSFMEDTTASGINPMGGVELKVFIKDKQEAEKIIMELKL
jgi:hypothetical protein